MGSKRSAGNKQLCRPEEAAKLRSWKDLDEVQGPRHYSGGRGEPGIPQGGLGHS